MFVLQVVLIITIFTIKDAKLYVHVVTLSAKFNKKPHETFSGKDLIDEFIRMILKQVVTIKIIHINIDTFSNQILLELIDYLY